MKLFENWIWPVLNNCSPKVILGRAVSVVISLFMTFGWCSKCYYTPFIIDPCLVLYQEVFPKNDVIGNFLPDSKSEHQAFSKNFYTQTHCFGKIW